MNASTPVYCQGTPSSLHLDTSCAPFSGQSKQPPAKRTPALEARGVRCVLCTGGTCPLEGRASTRMLARHVWQHVGLVLFSQSRFGDARSEKCQPYTAQIRIMTSSSLPLFLCRLVVPSSLSDPAFVARFSRCLLAIPLSFTLNCFSLSTASNLVNAPTSSGFIPPIAQPTSTLVVHFVSSSASTRGRMTGELMMSVTAFFLKRGACFPPDLPGASRCSHRARVNGRTYPLCPRSVH